MATQTKKSAFEKLSAVNVSEKVERKGQLSYLSWAHAWAYAKKLYPKYFYESDSKGISLDPIGFNFKLVGFTKNRLIFKIMMCI